MKFKRVIILAIFLLSAASLFAAEPSRPPIVVQEMGQGVPVYEPVRWPFFEDMSGEQACINYCATISGEPRPGTFGFRDILATTVNFTGSNGIGAAYQENTNIFVTWTVRVIGESVFLPLWLAGGAQGVCEAGGAGGWHGYVNEIFPGGTVSTRLMVVNQQEGNIARMTIPSGLSQDRNTPSDPTIVGSALLRSEDFPRGRFPASLDFAIQWRNDDTTLTLTSPLDDDNNTTRNLIITIMPVQE